MSIPAEKQERFHFLDGLRGIAASMIVFHHAFTSNVVHILDHLKIPFLSYLFANFTQSGVDLFFVLSGVVLLRPYLRGQRKFKLLDYLWRRVKRIYPPYFFALIFASIVVWVNTEYATWYNLKGMRVKFSWLETWKELFLINRDGVYYNLAWWSLGIEMLFYVVAPVIVFMFPPADKLNNRNITVTILLTLAATIGLQFYFTDHVSNLYSLTYNSAIIGRFIEYPVCFLMGVFLAAKDFTLKHALIFIVAGLVIICSSWMYVPYIHARYAPLLHSGYGLVYAGIVTMAFNIRSFRHFLDKPIMIWIGERSYSLFLIHFSVFYLVDNIVSHFTTDRNVWYGTITRGIGVPVAIFAAMLLFWFVERRQARGLVTGNLFWPWQVKQLGRKIQDT